MDRRQRSPKLREIFVTGIRRSDARPLSELGFTSISPELMRLDRFRAPQTSNRFRINRVESLGSDSKKCRLHLLLSKHRVRIAEGLRKDFDLQFKHPW